MLLASMVLVGAFSSEALAKEGTTVTLDRAFPELRFVRPVLLTHANDGRNRVFVVEQAGTIRVLPNTDTIPATGVFLDIRDRVNSVGNEQGMLGLAFDPGFADNGYFYVNYTADGPSRSVVSRFSVSTDPDLADLGSELVILEVGQPFTNHNGGMIEFGPDGMLYIGLGDGGAADDPFGHGQNPSSLLGTILRLDVSQSKAGEPYSIPIDNPFFGGLTMPSPNEVTPRPEVWAYGFRNPWRFSFDGPSASLGKAKYTGTGDLWVGDVGQTDWEEVNVVEKAGNYGWNIMEGANCFLATTCEGSDLEPPIVEYRNAGDECSVTGGRVYRGQQAPALAGHYLYSDFCSGRIWALRYEQGVRTGPVELLQAGFKIPSFGIDEQGEIYVLGFDGRVYRFVADGTVPVLPQPLAPVPTPTPPPLPPLANVPDAPASTATPASPTLAPVVDPSPVQARSTATPVPRASVEATPGPTPGPTPTPTPFDRFRIPFDGAPILGLIIIGIIAGGSLALVMLARLRGASA